MNGTAKFGLSVQTLASLKAVFSRYPGIERVILYGSRAKGNFKVGSDIDLTLVAPKLDLTSLFKIEDDIEELMLPYQVDLSLFHQIENPDLREHIERVGVTF